ncbi:unnamed protein product [Urochloa humidicola]
MRELTVSATRLQFVLAAAALVSLSPRLLLAAVVGRIGLPSCTTVCGDVSVPYPFGIGPGCYLPGFNLTCDTSRTPARLSLGGNGTLKVIGISLDNATVRVQGPAINMDLPRTATSATGGNGTWGGPAWGLSDGGSYMLSAASNELIVTGCNLFVELLVMGDDSAITSCGTVCGTVTRATPTLEPPVRTSPGGCKKCSGIGCCQTPVPTAATTYDVRLLFVYVALINPSPPDLSFSVLIAEEGWFDGNYSAFNSTAVPPAERGTHVPAVLTWAIRSSVLQGSNKTLDGNATCPSEIAGSSTACHSRYSSCTSIHPSDNTIRGYTCKCWDGYQGNPYLTDGCQGKHLFDCTPSSHK